MKKCWIDCIISSEFKFLFEEKIVMLPLNGKGSASQIICSLLLCLVHHDGSLILAPLALYPGMGLWYFNILLSFLANTTWTVNLGWRFFFPWESHYLEELCHYLLQSRLTIMVTDFIMANKTIFQQLEKQKRSNQQKLKCYYWTL